MSKIAYPDPPDFGSPPDVVREWTDKLIDSWNLTAKERAVCEYLLKGLRTKEIADLLGNTDKTLKHHIASIYGKAHVGTRAELFAEILRR
jgi:DNA-binding CsgD family transcriptional regulator